MTTRARKRRLLMHLHPEYGMADKRLFDAHAAAGFARGVYEAEVNRLHRAQDEVTKWIKEERKARDEMNKRGDAENYSPEAYRVSKAFHECAESSLLDARIESRAASLAVREAREIMAEADATLVKMRWWDHTWPMAKRRYL